MHRRLILLGSTGSIGQQTLQVVRYLNTLAAQRITQGAAPGLTYDVVGLAAGSRGAELEAQAREFPGAKTAIAAPGIGLNGFSYVGADAARRLVEETRADLIVAAMVGAAGIPATLAAVQSGCDVALANKETLVAAGCIVLPAALSSGSRLLPVDSEHAGVWQCLSAAMGSKASVPPTLRAGEDILRVTLTASGGPFRNWSLEQMKRATPQEARKHPTWIMGDKVTIDSASLMNKALELIEAHWLFGLCAAQLHAVIHPQSFVHALVEFADSTTIAQIAPPDMCTPIHRALTYPLATPSQSKRLDWATLCTLTFEPVDQARFPAVEMAKALISQSAGKPALGTWFNAANEVASAAFLQARIPFTSISEVVGEVVEATPSDGIISLADVLAADKAAREAAELVINRDGA